MTITLELTPQEEVDLQEFAAKQGTTVQKLARRGLGLPAEISDAEHTASETPENNKARAWAALMQQWCEEEAARPPEEAVRAEVDLEALLDNVASNRVSFPIPDVNRHD